MQITEGNIVNLLIKMQEAIQEGWRLVPNKSWLSYAFVNEITLYKESVDIKKVEDFEAEQITVLDFDANKFLFELQSCIVSGFEMQLDTLSWDNIGTKRVVLTRSQHPAMLTYTKEQLQEMSYDELKYIAKCLDCFHRSKDQMIRNILIKQEEKK